MPYLCKGNMAMNDDISTSGPIEGSFISESEVLTSYEEMAASGFNRLVKARRQGRWFMLKGLKPAFRGQPVYLELLKKEYALMVQLDHPNIVKAYAKEENEVLGPCIVMEYVDGIRLDEFLSGKPSAAVRRKILDQLVDALSYIHSKQILHRDLANRIPEADWNGILEPAGAVFLPEAGARTISGIFTHIGGYYTSEAASSDAWHLLFGESDGGIGATGHRGDGLSVRLVREKGE